MSELSFQIREAVESDISAIQSLVQELADYEKLSDEVVATDELVKESLFSENAVARALIAEQNGKSVGMAIYFFNYSTFLGQPGLYLEDLFVKKEMRGSGIGKALLVELAKIAVAKDCGRFEWSVLDWNKPAIDFYESIGAKKQEGWSVYRLTGEPLQKLAQQKSQPS